MSKLTAKQQYWSEQLQRAEESGVSLANYARANNVPVQKLYQWRSTLRKQTITSVTTETQFAQVVHSSLQTHLLTVSFCGAQLSFNTLPDPAWLSQLLNKPTLPQ